MQQLALRALAWFTWSHIQWLLVQLLNNKGLYHAMYRVAITTSTDGAKHKAWDKITLKEAMTLLNPDANHNS